MTKFEENEMFDYHNMKATNNSMDIASSERKI
jgi:hypothetical protein